MIPADFLATLRCPMDPARDATLTEADDAHLVCERCRLRFPIRDGFPNLIAEDAALPAGVATLGDLPCQQPFDARS